MTTRKTLRPDLLLATLALVFAGCSTPGPTRGYYLRGDQNDRIVRFDPSDPRAPVETQESYLRSLDVPLGMAYDPFTDHFFIRLNQGNAILVVDRPDHSIKRLFRISGHAMPEGPGDIAIRSIDRHLFLADPREPALVETTLDGVFVRSIPLPAADRAPVAVAYDQSRDRLLTVSPERPDRVDIRMLDGTIASSVSLDHATDGQGLAFDSKAREYYAVLAGANGGLGVFAADGHLARVLPLPANHGPLCFDVGPHSFLRLF